MNDLVVITDCDHPEIAIEREVLARAGLRVERADAHTAGEVVATGAGAVALVTQYAPVTAEVLAALPACRVVARYGTGLDTVDTAAAAARGVAVVSVPDYAVTEVADHTIGLVLACTRGIVRLDRAVRAGGWDAFAAGPLRRTSALRLGVVGLGRIGAAVAARAMALGFTILGHDPRMDAPEGVTAVGLDELLATSDVVTLHAALSEATRHLIDAAALARMRSCAVLVNTSRGGLVDQDALVAALAAGHLGGAALDVTADEPPARDSPLRSLDRVVLTPHVGFYSVESLVEMKRRVAEGVVAALREAAGLVPASGGTGSATQGALPASPPARGGARP